MVIAGSDSSTKENNDAMRNSAGRSNILFNNESSVRLFGIGLDGPANEGDEEAGCLDQLDHK